MIKLTAYVSIVAAVLGCRGHMPSSPFADITETGCARGEPISYSLAPPPFAPDATAMHYDRDFTNALVTPSAQNQVQLDLCFTDNSQGIDFKLRRLIFVENGQQTALDGTDATVEGLREAITNGAWDKLHILAMTTVFGPDGASSQGYELHGWHGASGSFVTGVRLVSYGFADAPLVASVNALAGVFAEGSVIGNLRCHPGATFVTSSYRIDNASLTTEFCRSDAGDQSFGYHYLTARLQDGATNEVIDEAHANLIESVATHHNQDDHVTFKFSSATYSWQRRLGDPPYTCTKNGQPAQCHFSDGQPP